MASAGVSRSERTGNERRARGIIQSETVSSERPKRSDDVATEVALALGKDAAKRAVDGLLSSDEERAGEEAERPGKSKSRRNKLIAYGVVALLVLVGIAGLMLRFWPWFLLLGIVGFVGLYGWSRIRKRFSAKKAEPALRVEESAVAQNQIPAARIDAEEARAREAQAREEARAIEESEIEDELAAMKARLDK